MSAEETEALIDGNDPMDPPKTVLEKIITPRVVLALFTLVNFITYYDRGVVSGALTSIRSDSAISGGDKPVSDTEGGFIVSAFMIGFMITCPLFAALGGTFTAKQIILAGMLVWAGACILTGFSKGYGMILAARMFVGVGEAAYAGFTVTIIDNIAPKDGRTRWIGTFYSMIPVGTAIGMAAGGVLSSDGAIGAIPGWRVAFFTEVMAAVPIILLVAFLPNRYNPKIKKRGDRAASVVDTPTPSPTSTTATVGQGDSLPASAQRFHSLNENQSEGTSSHLAVASENAAAVEDPTASSSTPGGESEEYVNIKDAAIALITNIDYVLVVIGYAMYVFVTGAIAVWAISMLTEGPLHLTTVEASLLVGAATALTGVFGSIAGGLFVDKMGGSQGLQGTMKCQLFNAGMMIIAVPCGVIALNSSSMPLFIVFFILGVFAVFAVTAPVNASILTVVPSNLRTYAISFSVFSIHLMGDFPSPTATGSLADRFDNGCSNFVSNTTCTADPGKDCRWVPPKDDAQGFCVNIYELQKALVIVFCFLLIAVPAWLVVFFRARRKLKQQALALLVQEDRQEVAVDTGAASDLESMKSKHSF
jgi:MFS family permease